MDKVKKNVGENKHLNDMMQSAINNVPEQMRTFMEQNQAIIDLLNEHTKAIVSLYELQKEIAKSQKVKIPVPHTEMRIE